MSTTPHMSPLQQQGQQQQGQQGPSTAPPQQSGQQSGRQQQQPFGQQGMRGMQGMPGMQGPQGTQGMQGAQQQAPPHLQQQLKEIGQQQPYQQLLQQLGQESIPQAQAPEISTQAVASNVATSFWDVVQPLPSQASALYLWVDDAWRVFINPNPQTRDEVQTAFAFGQRVYGYYDTTNPAYLVAVVVTK
ncbi:hypothetical protein AB0I66_28740 [Streptomyces sp. NPDC050439]|uniref:hypothetical protein n=1 Tax=unclassified Streptomyces TaxID=2593676 RepID=UPI0034411125